MTTERLTVGTEEISLHVTSRDSGGSLLVFDVRMPPGGGPPALHRHEPLELYRVQRGELAFYVADEHGEVRREVARPGTVVTIPGGREHTIRNESGADAEAMVVFSPGEAMEGFARGAGAVSEPGEVLALAAAHGIEITRPLESIS